MRPMLYYKKRNGNKKNKYKLQNKKHYGNIKLLHLIMHIMKSLVYNF